MSTLQRIEQLTSAFESLAFVLRLRAQAFKEQSTGKRVDYVTEGAIEHAVTLREHVRQIGADFGQLDIERYLPLRDGQIKAFGMFGNVPVEVAAWSTNSRRVYAPTLDAQTILAASKLDEVTWADVQWPFGAFAIELAEPIADPHGNTYDTMLVFRERSMYGTDDDAEPGLISEDQLARTENLIQERGERFAEEYVAARERVGNDIVLIRLLGPSLERAIATKAERVTSRELLRKATEAQHAFRRQPKFERYKKEARKAWYKFWEHHGALHRRIVEVVTPFFPLSIERHGDMSVTKSVDALRKTTLGACTCGKPNCFRGADHPELDVAAQLVVGLCLYLRTAPRPTQPLVGQWEPLPLLGKIIHNQVTSEAVRCEVRASRTFTQDQRDRILGRGKYTQGKWAEIAWTAAYNRRPMGKGNDPTAEKTVRIESYPSLRWFSKESGTEEERTATPIRLT